MPQVEHASEHFSQAELMLRWVLSRHYYKTIMRIVRANGLTPYSTIQALVPFHPRYVRHYAERLVKNGLLKSDQVGLGNFVNLSCTPLGAFVVDSLDLLLSGMEDIGVKYTDEDRYQEPPRKAQNDKLTKAKEPYSLFDFDDNNSRS